ncbi:MAG TPA: hypothetical protein VEV41_12650 [Terriglobales bacterium]|nr:hypothetical protein [Terriglobales bacterium]
MSQEINGTIIVCVALRALGFQSEQPRPPCPKETEVKQTYSVTEFCVYTIRDGKELARLAKEGNPCSFEERKSWVTAGTLFQKAQLAKKAMPELFGDASDCRRLLFWGLLTDVTLRDGLTSFAVDRLRRFNGKHAPQELVLRSSGKQIAPNFIRPYAICRTPQFLDSKRHS